MDHDKHVIVIIFIIMIIILCYNVMISVTGIRISVWYLSI